MVPYDGNTLQHGTCFRMEGVNDLASNMKVIKFNCITILAQHVCLNSVAITARQVQSLQ